MSWDHQSEKHGEESCCGQTQQKHKGSGTTNQNHDGGGKVFPNAGDIMGHLCFARTCQCPKSYHTADPLKKHEENLKFLLPFICQNCWGFVCLWPLTQQLPFHIWVQFWHIDIFCLVKCWTCNWVGWKHRNVQRFLDHWRGKSQHVPKLGGQMAKRSQMRFIMVHYCFIEDRTCP